jgi:hypothetical protein
VVVVKPSRWLAFWAYVLVKLSPTFTLLTLTRVFDKQALGLPPT